jgi:hypothetical protein
MPIELKFLDKGAGVLYRFKGPVVGKEIIETNEKVFSSPDFKRIKYGVIDQTQVESLNVSTVDLLMIARQENRAADVNSEAAVALIAASEFAFGLSRTWETMTYNTPWQKKVFRSNDEAYAWTRARIKEKCSIDPRFA